MGNKIGNDPAFTPFGLRVVKTPGHPMWKTWDIHNHTYNLDELAEYLELENVVPFQKNRQVEYTNEDSRHCLLFDEVRWYAYSTVKEFKCNGGMGNFEKALLSFAEEKNTFRQRGFSADLSASQVKATVKSVCTWAWTKYTGSGRIRGVMKLSNQVHLTQREKQQRSAFRTAKIRKEKTIEKINWALKEIKRQGLEISYKLIGEFAGLTRQTVSKYKEFFGRKLNGSGIKPKSSKVNFAAHQISEPEGLQVNQSLAVECHRYISSTDSGGYHGSFAVVQHVGTKLRIIKPSNRGVRIVLESESKVGILTNLFLPDKILIDVDK